MKIAFVSVEKNWKDLENRDYVDKFIKYHLEFPYYYARDGKNYVSIVTDYETKWKNFDSGGAVRCISHENFKNIDDVDVVIHFRKWSESCYRKNAINVLVSQDHSYSAEWHRNVQSALKDNKLYAILCFPGWHEQHLRDVEFHGLPLKPRLISGVTLGVDTETYAPAQQKSHYDLLWASDPGRGFMGAIQLAMRLFQIDKRFKLHFCWPDYVKGDFLLNKHPAIQLHRNLDNGPELWNLFATCGFLPYTSTFPEPSSRAHRQAQAAGCVVLYPPKMGTPSDLIQNGVTGFVEPIDKWVDIIVNLARDEERYNEISKNTREFAISENWEVQAKRFNDLIKGIKENAQY